MKKIIAATIVTAMVFGTAAAVSADVSFAGKQTASAYLDQGKNEVAVTVDLSDGWSVDFAPGAVYLYDGPNDEGKEADAIGITLDEEVYNEQVAIAEDQKDFRQDDGITAFTHPDGTQDYYFAVGDNAFFLISVNKDFDGDAVMSRFAVEETGWIADYEEYSPSDIFSDEDIMSAMEKVTDEAAAWTGCEIHSLDYAGDDALTDEKLDWVNELDEGANYTQVMKLLMDFHSPTEEADLEGQAWDPDTEYTDYEWWLARTDGGEWNIVTYGY